MQKSPLKILFIPSDNNATSGAFLSMVKLCGILQQDYGCRIQVLLHCKGNGEELLSESHIPYRIVRSFNWFIPYNPHTFKRKIKRFLCDFWMPVATTYNKLAIKQIAALIQKESFDVVHINTSCTYVGAVAALKTKTPFVWHIREFLEEDQERCIWKKEKAYKLITKSSKVIAISKSIFEKYSQCIPDANLIQIYNGVDEKIFKCDAHSLFSDNTIHMVIVGSINQSKGQDQAIKACKELYDKGYKNFELKIAGKNSEYSKELERKVDLLGLRDKIRFIGPQKDVASLFRHSDITFMCSSAEAFGRVTVEAMMSGSLVIGANSGGTLELIEDGVTGILYQSGDYLDLAKKTIMAINDKQRMNSIARNGQMKMLSSMTAKKNAESIYNLYQELVSQKK